MPTDEELDLVARIMGYGSWRSVCNFPTVDVRCEVLRTAIAAKHAKAVCDLAEDSAKYMARIVM